MSQEKPSEVHRLPDETVTESQTAKKSRNTMRIIGVVAVVVVVLIVLGFVLMIQAGATGTVRDVVIILLAAESLIVVGLLLVLVYQMTMLIKMMREEVQPLIRSAQDTVNSARGTTQFISKRIVSPTVKMTTNVARLTRMVQVLFKGK
jgi:cytochrome c biogenesis protein CcdA